MMLSNPMKTRMGGEMSASPVAAPQLAHSKPTGQRSVVAAPHHRATRQMCCGGACDCSCRSGGSSLDGNTAVRQDRSLAPCVARDYRPSRGWQVPVGLLSLAVVGVAGELLVASPARSSMSALTGCAMVTAVCVMLSVGVLWDQPYAAGHAWKRWLRALTLLLAALTSWLNLAQLAASGSLGGGAVPGTVINAASAASVVGPLAFGALGLGSVLLAALLSVVAGALGQDTAVAIWCGRRCCEACHGRSSRSGPSAVVEAPRLPPVGAVRAETQPTGGLAGMIAAPGGLSGLPKGGGLLAGVSQSSRMMPSGGRPGRRDMAEASGAEQLRSSLGSTRVRRRQD